MRQEEVLILLVVVLTLAFLLLSTKGVKGSGAPSTLFTDASCSNLYLHAKIGNHDTVFLIDTGFAGPPVLNTHFMTFPLLPEYRGVVDRVSVMKGSKFGIGHDVAVRRFISTTGARDFTAGCRVNLSGITSSYQRHSDLLLVPTISFKSNSGFSFPGNREGDICVTNNMVDTPHIITTDYLRHNSPCLISISKSQIEWNISKARTAMLLTTFTRTDIEWFGGAMVCVINVGNVNLKCVVDTGSELSVTIGKSCAKRIHQCDRLKRKVGQSGVGGQSTCTEFIETYVQFAGIMFPKCSVAVNNTDVTNIDGYVGMGVLRCFDILIFNEMLYLKKNSVWDPATHAGVVGTCSGMTDICKSSS